MVGLSGAERQELSERVVSAMKETDLPFHVYNLHQVRQAGMQNILHISLLINPSVFTYVA